MIKHLTIAFLSLFSFAFASLPQEHPLDNFAANGISYVWEQTPNYAQCKELFFQSFAHSYRKIPLEVLRQPNLEALDQWLLDSFDEIYEEYLQTGHNLRWLTAKKNGYAVGCLLVDFANYPKEVYLSQMAVDPSFQHQGIGRHLVGSILDLLPETEKLVVITRKANVDARSFWQAVGFKGCDYIHPGYDPELYAGYEYISEQ